MEKVATRGSSLLGVYEDIQGWDWDGIMILNSLTFVPAFLSYKTCTMQVWSGCCPSCL